MTTDSHTTTIDIEHLIETFPREGVSLDSQSITYRPLSPREAETIPASEVLRPGLDERYPYDPFSHQADALAALAQGKNVTVATSTSSGKTDIYALQIARNLLDAEVLAPDGSRTGEDGATALCIYPTKALAADQHEALDDLYDEMGLDVRVARYDGDTPRADRREIRERADVILTNPMGVSTYLHDHDRWSRFYSGLDLVVLDESHTHTGVQGMHVAWILRRLRRVVDHWGGNPQYVLTSATIGNPAEHSEQLLDEAVTVVDDDGSPRGPRDLLLWNPPPTDGDDTHSDGAVFAADEPPTAPGVDGGITARLPASVDAPRVWNHLTYHGVDSLLFCPSRKLTEIAVQRANEHRESAGSQYPPPRPELAAYNAGMGRVTRQDRERSFKDGSIAGLATTSALELGIDIGDLDGVVLLGYPGQRQRFWQRIGRAGRGGSRSVGVLVADHRTLDQYVIDNPEYLLDTDVEDAVVDTGNDAVFAQHLLCAADEIALDESDIDTFAGEKRLRAGVEMWRRTGRLTGYLDAVVHYAGARRPQTGVSIYGTGGDEYELRLADGVDESAVGEFDAENVAQNRAYRDYHEGAVRLFDGEQFEVTGVHDDRPQPTIELEPVDREYYTRTLTDVNVVDAESEQSREVNGFRLHFGTGTVLVHHHSYDQVYIESNEPKERMLPTGRPPIQMDTQLCWVEVPEDVERSLLAKYREHGTETGIDPERADAPQMGYVAGLHAAEHAMIKTAPLELLVDQNDLGGLSTLVLDSHYASPEHDELGATASQSMDAVEAVIANRAAESDGTASGWFLYDGVEGGIGFARAIYEEFETLSAHARDRLEDCECGRPDGCPACTYSENCGNDNAPLLRGSAIDVFEYLLGERSRGELDEGSESQRRPALFYA
ncbi:DEAD/DEAH box helicase [Natranaeroarchaeum sulfidigenes]|uniref:Distinct helicase family with a unique C-terminal domain including a metal-binding cysteine cluster n=1 Tax=Natranaeroarchaeum sulfidigenes TaxID=2784880 RepID=A0A897MW07_9EURY|nr:DEAD/DEAH box helicase [Natranaeroarchaeum sulfidigenes]QSG02346.1 Distinct helicase family with a unique C-terminal domain including a metal-binding cysteine cluster [Natranaeroarchaeum sulfidigenes]